MATIVVLEGSKVSGRYSLYAHNMKELFVKFDCLWIIVVICIVLCRVIERNLAEEILWNLTV